MNQTDSASPSEMPSGPDGPAPDQVSAAARRLLERMYQAFDAVRAELDLGEGLLRSFGLEPDSESPLASATGTSAFNTRELRELAGAVGALEARCLEGLGDPAVRGLAERVASQSSAMMLSIGLFMLDFGERVRSLRPDEAQG